MVGLSNSNHCVTEGGKLSELQRPKCPRFEKPIKLRIFRRQNVLKDSLKCTKVPTSSSSTSRRLLFLVWSRYEVLVLLMLPCHNSHTCTAPKCYRIDFREGIRSLSEHFCISNIRKPGISSRWRPREPGNAHTNNQLSSRKYLLILSSLVYPPPWLSSNIPKVLFMLNYG